MRKTKSKLLDTPVTKANVLEIAASEVARIDRRTLPKDQRAEPTTGQSGSLIKLTAESLYTNEAEICAAFDLCEAAGMTEVSTQDLFDACSELGFDTVSKLRIRNGLRRLVRAKWIARIDRATYQRTKLGARGWSK